MIRLLYINTMNIKSSSQLVAEALKEIQTISTDEAFQIVESNNCNLIDIRDIRELEKEGRVENSHHIPRGMLEFWLDPNSPYFKEGKLDQKNSYMLSNGEVKIVDSTVNIQNIL